jgi:CRP-like cAMP-binding protein
MATKRRRSFDTKSFLARVGDGHSIGKYRKGETIFSQGDPGDAVFYIQKGQAKLTVVSEQGKEAVIAVLGTDEFFGEGLLILYGSNCLRLRAWWQSPLSVSSKYNARCCTRARVLAGVGGLVALFESVSDPFCCGGFEPSGLGEQF